MMAGDLLLCQPCADKRKDEDADGHGHGQCHDDGYDEEYLVHCSKELSFVFYLSILCLAGPAEEPTCWLRLTFLPSSKPTPKASSLAP